MSHSSEIINPSSDLDEDVLIKVDNVSKKFCRDFKKSLWYGLKDTAADIVDPTHKSQDLALRPGEFWANQNISFEVKRGECLGLIGHNGAGKTTLLKMLNGLIKPDTGSIEMRGRIGALIALGAGFNPILTGRENVYVNGSILGLHKKEIDGKLEEIIDFAEIEEAIDAPVRTYSSGMQVRLGFSVAVILFQPDVLILDEVLAVGDVGFVIKCLNRVQEILETAAVILVSHSPQYISRFCSRAIYLEAGRVDADNTDVSQVIAHYMDKFKLSTALLGGGAVTYSNATLSANPPHPEQGKLNRPTLCGTATVIFSVDVDLGDLPSQAKIKLFLEDQTLAPIAEIYLKDNSLKANKCTRIRAEIAGLALNPGLYSFLIVVTSPDENHRYLRASGVCSFSVLREGPISWASFRIAAK